MRENRSSGSEGGEAELNRPFLPLSFWSQKNPISGWELFSFLKVEVFALFAEADWLEYERSPPHIGL
jgi:hypothetical protein